MRGRKKEMTALFRIEGLPGRRGKKEGENLSGARTHTFRSPGGREKGENRKRCSYLPPSHNLKTRERESNRVRRGGKRRCA